MIIIRELRKCCLDFSFIRSGGWCVCLCGWVLLCGVAYNVREV